MCSVLISGLLQVSFGHIIDLGSLPLRVYSVFEFLKYLRTLAATWFDDSHPSWHSDSCLEVIAFLKSLIMPTSSEVTASLPAPTQLNEMTDVLTVERGTRWY